MAKRHYLNSLYYSIMCIYYNFDIERYEQNLNESKLLDMYEKSLEGYEVLFSFFDYSNLKEDHYLYPLSKDVPKQCIFCLKSETDVKFSSRPHVIPEFLGNKYLLHYEECDNCNSYFSSTLEDALDKYTKIYRTLDRIKNKRKKIPEYNSIDQKSKVTYNKSNETFIFRGYLDKDFVFNDESNVLKANFEIAKHRPINIYKAFMKIFYGLLPREHHKNFTSLIEWIRNKDPEYVFIKPLEIIKTKLPYLNKKPLTIEILYKKSKDIKKIIKESNKQDDFEYIALIAFGNIIFEMPILSDIDIFKQTHLDIKMNLKRIPNPYFIKEYECIDLSECEAITSTETIFFSYGKRVAVEELKGTLIDEVDGKIKDLKNKYINIKNS